MDRQVSRAYHLYCFDNLSCEYVFQYCLPKAAAQWMHIKARLRGNALQVRQAFGSLAANTGNELTRQ